LTWSSYSSDNELLIRWVSNYGRPIMDCTKRFQVDTLETRGCQSWRQENELKFEPSWYVIRILGSVWGEGM